MNQKKSTYRNIKVVRYDERDIEKGVGWVAGIRDGLPVITTVGSASFDYPCRRIANEYARDFGLSMPGFRFYVVEGEHK